MMLVFFRRVSAIVVALCVPTLLAAQQDAFVGVWELESWELRHDDGRVTKPFGGGEIVGEEFVIANGGKCIVFP